MTQSQLPLPKHKDYLSHPSSPTLTTLFTCPPHLSPPHVWTHAAQDNHHPPQPAYTSSSPEQAHELPFPPSYPHLDKGAQTARPSQWSSDATSTSLHLSAAQPPSHPAILQTLTINTQTTEHSQKLPLSHRSKWNQQCTTTRHHRTPPPPTTPFTELHMLRPTHPTHSLCNRNSPPTLRPDQ
jgi:hypothetical protein